MEPFVLAAIRKAKFQFGSVCFLTTCSVQINETKARIHCVGKVQLSLCFSKGVYRKLICQLNNIKSIFWVSRY